MTLPWEDDDREPIIDTHVEDSRSPIELGRLSVRRENSARGTPLYLDIETVPDESREELFGLEPVPQPAPETLPENCPPEVYLLEKSLDEIKSTLLRLNPHVSYLVSLGSVEAQSKKPRAGVRDAIAAVYAARDRVLSAADERRKVCATTPEFCRIVAVGVAAGEEPAISFVSGKHLEQEMLDIVWTLILGAGPIVGYNIIGFDLQVIRARSILLNVVPSRLLNDSPWNNRDVTDLMLCRFGRSGKAMKLKDLARLYGIDAPAGETSGADVERLLAEDPEALGRYVRSDVEITRALHRKWSGYFCV